MLERIMFNWTDSNYDQARNGRIWGSRPNSYILEPRSDGYHLIFNDEGGEHHSYWTRFDLEYEIWRRKSGQHS